MANVIPFQSPSRVPPPPTIARPLPQHGTVLPTAAGRHGEYALADIARPLGLLHKSVRTIIDTLRVLAKDAGMPLPRTPRVVKDAVICGPRSICKDSRWDAGEIDAWLDSRGPAGPSAAGIAATPRPLAPPLRAEMAARALQLGAAGR